MSVNFFSLITSSWERGLFLKSCKNNSGTDSNRFFSFSVPPNLLDNLLPTLLVRKTLSSSSSKSCGIDGIYFKSSAVNVSEDGLTASTFFSILLPKKILGITKLFCRIFLLSCPHIYKWFIHLINPFEYENFINIE
ncbi:hypothetical protein WN66_06103 [Saccharomyces cerevisiae]|nr:hypothetical protein WN66_06103 [Saccharomyces cerevisiae]